MLWSKITFFFLAVFLAVATLLLAVLPRSVRQDLDGRTEAHLQSAGRGAGLLLKIHARKWIDAAAQASLDAQLVEFLDQATRGGANIELQHRSAQARLREFNGQWKTDLLIAVDGRGHVLARVGLDEQLWRDDLSGYPLVSDALRGYRLDDTWDMGGRLYRVAASPVITHDRYVGCLVVAHELGSELAGRIRDAIGVDIAFLVRGQAAGQSSSLPVLGELTEMVKRHGVAEMSEPETLRAGDRTFMALAVPLVGEAMSHEAAYVLVAETAAATTFLGSLRSIRASMLTPTDAAVALGVLVLLIVFGLAVFYFEINRPLAHLATALRTLTPAAPRVDDRRFRGQLGRLARSVNQALERVRGGKKTGLQAITGSPSASFGQVRPSAKMAKLGASVGMSQLPRTSAPHAIVPAAEAPAVPLSPPPALLAPPPAASPPPPPLTPLPEPIAAPLPPMLGEAAAPLAPLDTPAYGSLPAKGDGRRAQPVGPTTSEEFDEPPTLIDARDLVLLSKEEPGENEDTGLIDGRANDPQSEYQSVFREFVETKRRCGEATDSVTFEKFRVKLEQNREQLLARFDCKTVKFQVYVKDGKAALKAVPVPK